MSRRHVNSKSGSTSFARDDPTNVASVHLVMGRPYVKSSEEKREREREREPLKQHPLPPNVALSSDTNVGWVVSHPTDEHELSLKQRDVVGFFFCVCVESIKFLCTSVQGVPTNIGIVRVTVSVATIVVVSAGGSTFELR